MPVAFDSCRAIHPRILSQTQNILHRNNDCIRDRSKRQFEQCPVNLVCGNFAPPLARLRQRRDLATWACPRAGNTIEQSFLLLSIGLVFEPALYGVIIVRAGIENAISYKVTRIVSAGLEIFAEGGLKHFRAGEIEFVPKRSDVWSDSAEVFSKKGRDRKVFENFFEKVFPRPSYPFARRGGSGTSRFDKLTMNGNLPIGGETPEMVEPNDIKQIKIMREPCKPPAVAGFFKSVPIVNRIIPKLSCPAEHIRRNAGDETGPFRFGQFEKFRMQPNIRTFVSNVKGNIANEFDAELMTITLQSQPLLEEYELEKLFAIDCISKLDFYSFKSGLFMVSQFGRPLRPQPISDFASFFACATKDRLATPDKMEMSRNGCKNGEVFKPGFVLCAEPFILRIISAFAKASADKFKMFISKIEKLFLVSGNRPVVDLRFRKVRFISDVLLIEKALSIQQLWTDEQSISRKGG